MGMGMGMGCCSTPCTPACATVGSVGSDTGGLCTDCSTQVIIDHFGSLDPAWISSPGGCVGNGIGTVGPQAHVTGGVMDMGGGACILRPFTRPSLSGLCIQVRAKIVAVPNGTAGIVLAYGRYFFARKTLGDYGRQSCIDANGCIDISGNFTNFGTFAAGDIISFVFKDAGAGDGVCTVCYLVNGTTVRVETGVTTCFPDPMYAGLQAATGTATQFDDFEVRTN